MKYHLTKISIITAIVGLFFSCNAVKRVPDGEYLLTESTIYVDSVKITDAGVYSQLSQRSNPHIPLIKLPLGLHIYNLADLQPDSTFNRWLHKKPKREARLVRLLSKKQVDGMDSIYVGINRWIEKSGDEPVVISPKKTEKSLERLHRWYASYGYFNNNVKYEMIPDEAKEKRAKLVFHVETKQPYFIGDTITENISSPIVDSLFQETKNKTFIKPNRKYNAKDFVNERDRLTIQFRNSGLYYFDQDYVLFEADTIDTAHKANISYIIPDRKVVTDDSTYTKPFEVYNVNKVRIITDYAPENVNKSFTDSVEYKGYQLFSYEKMRYRPKAIVDAIAITPGEVYKDIDRSLTYNQLNDLRIFKYPNITYREIASDSLKNRLDATVLLTPQKRFAIGADFDAFLSTIQQFGISFSGNMMFKNIFRGAETLQLSGKGSFGSSKDAADNSSKFFNISEFGADAKLTIPRIMFPINTDQLIPKYMSPTTTLSTGMSTQNNIGLDRQTVNGIFNYSWKSTRTRRYLLDLINIQYVKNLNTRNYFNVYKNSYTQLNRIAQQTELGNPGIINPNYYEVDDHDNLYLTIPEGAEKFIAEVREGAINPIWDAGDPKSMVDNIFIRKRRLTEDNLILATNISQIFDTRRNIKDNTFTHTRVKLETAGNLLTGIANLTKLPKTSEGNYEIFNVVYSQYVKGEVEFIKHWELDRKNALAFRAFAGLAIPYGNSNSIPFTRSYFGGGANDNRGWRAFDLGPGNSQNKDEFNEANFKLAFNAEYRFTLIGAIKGAVFTDVGNIWNVANDVNEREARFNGIEDLRDLAAAAGFGVRYDAGFFVLRLDVGFKAHNPAKPSGERWFKEFNFKNAVYNIGVNYPF